MPPERLRPALLVLLAVLAAGAAAATLDSGSLEEGDPGGPPDLPDGNRSGGGGGPSPNGSNASFALDLTCPSPLTDERALGGLGAALLLAGAAAYLRTRSGALVAAVGVPVALGVAALCPSTLASALFLPPALSPALIVGGLLLALLGAAVLVFVGSGDDLAPFEEAPPPEDADLDAVARAAGEAADRIEKQAEVDNEVYRAWREMTAHLDVAKPATSTPGEFREAAVAAGVTPAAVDELTDLFEEVRYGGADPATREERAVAALRRIETAHADPERDEAGEER